MESKTASVRASYVARFGEAEAAALEKSAREHANGINDADGYGDDPFKWTCLIAIGYQCAEVDSYRAHHGIQAPWNEIKAWLKSDAELHSHNGGKDHLTLFVGGYNEYMSEAVS